MKIKSFLATTAFLLFISINCFAQLENPCGGNGDPDDPTTCPIDNWVMILVIISLLFVANKLHRNQIKNSSPVNY